jgi:hypothetical protein
MIIQMRRLSSSAALLPPDDGATVVVVVGASCVPLPGTSRLLTVLKVMFPGVGAAAAALSLSSLAAVVVVRRGACVVSCGSAEVGGGASVVGGGSVVGGASVVDEVVGSVEGGPCWAKARDGPNHTARNTPAVTTPRAKRRGAGRPSPLRLPSSIQSTLWAPAGHERICRAAVDCTTPQRGA